MLRYLRLVVIPATILSLSSCGAGMSLDAGKRLEDANDLTGALSQYDQAIAEKPKLVAGYLGRARCLLKSGEPKAAEKTLRDAVNADKRDVDAKVALANVLELRKDLMEAKIQLGDAYVYDSKNLAVVVLQAKVFEDGGEYKEAVDKYKEALALEPNNIDTHTKLAHLYGIMNKFDDAKKELATIDKINLLPKK